MARIARRLRTRAWGVRTPLHATQRTTEMARLATTHCVPLREQKSCNCQCPFRRMKWSQADWCCRMCLIMFMCSVYRKLVLHCRLNCYCNGLCVSDSVLCNYCLQNESLNCVYWFLTFIDDTIRYDDEDLMCTWKLTENCQFSLVHRAKTKTKIRN